MDESYSSWKQTMVGKQEISIKQLVEKCNNLHISISCVVQLIDFS